MSVAEESLAPWAEALELSELEAVAVASSEAELVSAAVAVASPVKVAAP